MTGTQSEPPSPITSFKPATRQPATASQPFVWQLSLSPIIQTRVEILFGTPETNVPTFVRNPLKCQSPNRSFRRRPRQPPISNRSLLFKTTEPRKPPEGIVSRFDKRSLCRVVVGAKWLLTRVSTELGTEQSASPNANGLPGWTSVAFRGPNKGCAEKNHLRGV